MAKTAFNTPIVTSVFAGLARLIMVLTGWRVANRPPNLDKYVLIAAPHTSNWDFPVMLGVVFSESMVLNWMGKHTLFPRPLGSIMRWLGGIPVDRRSAHNLVEQTAAAFQQRSQMIVVITPEGTRGQTERWKTGFYRIAEAAGVPIVLGWVDYPSKQVGFGPVFKPTGDLEADLVAIRDFYHDKTGKHPQLFSLPPKP